jgi:hypothetical protein
MTVQQVIGLAVRLVAFYFGLQALRELQAGFSVENASSFYFFSSVLYAVAAVWLWFFPMSVAHRLLPKTLHTDKIITNTNQLAVAGVALLGLWLLVVVIPNISYSVLMAVGQSGAGVSLFNALTEGSGNTVDLLANLVQVAVALVLLFNVRKIARLITK